jgi:hypothetical protein
MSESDLIVVRSGDGREWRLDEYNNTVQTRDANGVWRNTVDLNTRELGMADVHINSALANYAAGYKLADGIADYVAPAVLVDKASDYYYTWDKDDALQGAQTMLVSEASPIPEISPRLSSTLYTTAPFGLATFVPQGVLAAADAALNPRLAGINRLMSAMSIAREGRAAALMSTVTFSGYTAAIAAGAKWNGGATSDPIADLHGAIEAALMPITDIVMSEQVCHDFARNPNVAKYGLYKDNSKQLDLAQLSTVLSLPPITVGKMKGKSASAGTYGYTWGAGCLLLHREPGPTVDQMSISTAKTFRWRKGGLGSDANGFRVRQWFDPSKGQDGGEYIAVCCNEVVVATSAASGYYLSACHQ